MSQGQGGGQPTKYNKNRGAELQVFFEKRIKEDELPTLSGFAWEIGVCFDTLTEWRKKHKKFSVAVKKAKSAQRDMLQRMGARNRFNPTMSIFLLKNNHKFKDKHEFDHTTAGERIGSIVYTKPEGAKSDTPTP